MRVILFAKSIMELFHCYEKELPNGEGIALSVVQDRQHPSGDA